MPPTAEATIRDLLRDAVPRRAEASFRGCPASSCALTPPVASAREERILREAARIARVRGRSSLSRSLSELASSG